MAQHQEETQLGSIAGVPGHEDMATDELNKVENRHVFDGFSSSLKLNISNNNSGVVVKREEGVGVGGGGGLRTCSECGKQFSSGKALGGHKRACLQSKNNRLKLKPTIKIEVAVELGGGDSKNYLGGGGGGSVKTSNVDKAGGGDGNCRCCVCDQSFVTLKSLYGHMRKHPERHWRGIHPPQQQPPNHRHHHLSASSTISNDHNDRDNDNDNGDGDDVDVDVNDDDNDERAVAVDLVESLKGWSVKDKRGRKSSTSGDTAHPSNSVSSEEEEEADPVDKEAASNLFFLAQTLQNYESSGQSKKRKFDQVDRPSSGYGVLKIKERRPEADHDQESEMEMEMDILRKMKQQKKRKLTELESNTYRFHCPICNKGFDKHQALGGHVASHNNKSKNLVNSMKESSASVEEERPVISAAAAAAESDQEDSGEDDRSSRVNGELGDQQHQCNICSKNFPTGQALGGHKRCHWNGPNFPEAFSSSSQVTTSTGEVSQTPPPRGLLGGLDVDLNDTPQEFYQFYGFPEPAEEAGAGTEAGAGAETGAASKDNSVR
ncbi:hypothetical protein ACOSP7_029981 [Xanthoceras sorbifolium]